MNGFLILTAFTVSIDSFLCGLSLSFVKGKKSLMVLIVATTVFAMCLLTNYTAKLLSGILSERTACLGGLILIAVGVFNLLKKEDDEKIIDNGLIKESFISGFAVGLDGAFANLSLSLMGINAFYVPLTIAVMHALTISIGVIIASLPLKRVLTRYKFIPPLLLIALGVYKLLGLFI
ncbi:MAG: hypothetical protein E7369_03535 [Clostridiales bacterium]|nr:hypothetical protein [Clostridiales bacterium]